MCRFLSTLKIIFAVLFFFFSFLQINAEQTNAANEPYYHLVILGDPHLPGKYVSSKERVIRTVNSWDDVDMVIAVGDICESSGTDKEYAAAKKFFRKLNAPLFPIAGNHDFIYEDQLSPSGTRNKASSDVRAAKLRTFREAFGLADVFYSKRVEQYLLVFLSTDHLHSENLTEMSDRTLAWLRSELEKNKKTPTIIFFHAPLKDTLRDYNKHINTPTRIAQPSGSIHTVLMNSPQVFLWVSGHTHTSPKEESFASPVNVYAKRITNIHTTDMNRDTIWTNSLYLYPDKVVVRTYNHKKSAWLPELQRTVQLPALPLVK
jgi:Icc protein